MGVKRYFSESEEFLQGIETGIEEANDSGMVAHGIKEDDITGKYGFYLLVSDDDLEDDVDAFYNGSSFDYKVSHDRSVDDEDSPTP